MFLRSFIIIFLSYNLCFSQTKNTIFFKVVTQRDKLPLKAILTIEDSIFNRTHKVYSDSTGIIKFDLDLLKGDSGFVSLRIIADTLTTFIIYKDKVYNLLMVYYVDIEAIKKKYINNNYNHRRKRKNIYL